MNQLSSKFKLLDLNTLLLFIVSSVALTLFPGPDILYVFSTSLTQGKKKGIKVSLGLTTGLWVHTLLVIFGVGNILKIYPESQRILEIIGGSYLLFLALKSWRAPMQKTPSEKEKTNKPKFQYFFTGLVMNLTNPKVSLFFLSFFPGFIFHQDLSYSLQFFILGSLFFLQALVLFCMVSLFADAFARKLKIQKENNRWNKIQSLVLTAIALLLFYP